jgi:hypothetical protein
MSVIVHREPPSYLEFPQPLQGTYQHHKYLQVMAAARQPGAASNPDVLNAIRAQRDADMHHPIPVNPMAAYAAHVAQEEQQRHKEKARRNFNITMLPDYNRQVELAALRAKEAAKQQAAEGAAAAGAGGQAEQPRRRRDSKGGSRRRVKTRKSKRTNKRKGTSKRK